MRRLEDKIEAKKSYDFCSRFTNFCRPARVNVKSQENLFDNQSLLLKV